MDIGIFSGSFNPVHIGHLALANYLCEYEGLDEVWFMVTPHNPLKEEAEVKFKEVQQAYQQIMDERSRGYFSGAGSSAGYGGWYQNQQRTDAGDENSQYLRAAASYIQGGHYTEALNVLNSIKERGALWYFYSASANSGVGNNVTALEHAKEAVRLEPQNMQYQMLLQRLQGGGG